jgi:hypothetical protein
MISRADRGSLSRGRFQGNRVSGSPWAPMSCKAPPAAYPAKRAGSPPEGDWADGCLRPPKPDRILAASHGGDATGIGGTGALRLLDHLVQLHGAAVIGIISVTHQRSCRG